MRNDVFLIYCSVAALTEHETQTESRMRRKDDVLTVFKRQYAAIDNRRATISACCAAVWTVKFMNLEWLKITGIFEGRIFWRAQGFSLISLMVNPALIAAAHECSVVSRRDDTLWWFTVGLSFFRQTCCRHGPHNPPSWPQTSKEDNSSALSDGLPYPGLTWISRTFRLRIANPAEAIEIYWKQNPNKFDGYIDKISGYRMILTVSSVFHPRL